MALAILVKWLCSEDGTLKGCSLGFFPSAFNSLNNLNFRFGGFSPPPYDTIIACGKIITSISLRIRGIIQGLFRAAVDTVLQGVVLRFKV